MSTGDTLARLCVEQVRCARGDVDADHAVRGEVMVAFDAYRNRFRFLCRRAALDDRVDPEKEVTAGQIVEQAAEPVQCVLRCH